MQSTPGPASARPPMMVIAVAIVLALIGIGGIAAGVADKGNDKKDVASSGTTSTTDNGGFGAGDAGGSGSTAVTTPGATTTTAKAGVTTTTVPKTVGPKTEECDKSLGATADPGPHQPPAIGTFTYASCANASETRDTKVAAGTSSNGVTRRKVNSSESEFGQTATIAYGPSGVLLESLVAQSPQGNFTCDWVPDVVNYPAAMSVGAQWNTKSSCDLKQSNGTSPGKLNLDASGKVTGKVTYTVGSTPVNVWVIEAVIKLTTTVTGFGSSTATINQRSFYDPAHGLDLFRHSESHTEQGDIVRDERLVSLTPKSS